MCYMTEKIIEAVKQSYQTLNCTGAALIIYQNDELKVEQYWGTQSKEENARKIQCDTKFHIASCRKSYVAFAVAYALYNEYFHSLDDEIGGYLPNEKYHPLYEGVTIRHLVTHSHGLNDRSGKIIREFAPGSSWAYRGINVTILSDMLKHTTGRSIAQILQEEVFTPLGLTETNWFNNVDETFVELIDKETNTHWYAPDNIDGSLMNMYTTAHEFAKWGQFHLHKGNWKGTQIVAPEIIELATTVHSPKFKDSNLPDNGIFWYVKGSEATRSEIGEAVPYGAYQILGYTTVTLLVIPSENIVAVRMFNSFGSPEGYDYLRDVKDFGNAIMESIKVKVEI